MKFYPALYDTDVYLVTDADYDKENNDVTDFFKSMNYQYETLEDKDAYKEYKFDFVDYARDGIYKQVANSIDSKKNTSLPQVTSVKITKTDTVVPSSVFEHEDFANETEANAYEIGIEWEYKNGTGFQKKAVITVVKDGDKLSIAKMSEE
jgi:hypothetical protein